MLDINRVREHPEELEAGLKNRGTQVDLADFHRLDAGRRALLKKVEDLKARRNRSSEEIARLKKDKKDASSLIHEMRSVGDEIAALDAEVAKIEESLRALLLVIPNIPHATVPVGPDASANRLIREWGTKPAFDF